MSRANATKTGFMTRVKISPLSPPHYKTIHYALSHVYKNRSIYLNDVFVCCRHVRMSVTCAELRTRWVTPEDADKFNKKSVCPATRVCSNFELQHSSRSRIANCHHLSLVAFSGTQLRRLQYPARSCCGCAWPNFIHITAFFSLTVRHVRVLCQNEWTYIQNFSTIRQPTSF